MTFLIFLGVLSVLVLIHEFGHFAAALFLGVKVEEFALGLPFTKPLFKVIYKKIQFSIYPLLFGGFVKLYGEDGVSQTDYLIPGTKSGKGIDWGKMFWNRGKKQRLLVLSAGIFMNIVLALCLFVTLYLLIGVPSGTREMVTIDAVQIGSPAEKAGIKAGDRIANVAKILDLQLMAKTNTGKIVTLQVRRGETIALFEGIIEKNAQELAINVVPENGVIGVSIGEYPYVTTSKTGNVLLASIKATGAWGAKILDGFRSIGKSLMAGKKPEGVAGPIGIYQLTGVVAGEGIFPLMELVAILSLNLAIFNVLPIPALDGGRIFFVWLEWARRKRVSPELEAKINGWGMAVLLALMALISLQDVIRIWWK